MDMILDGVTSLGTKFGAFCCVTSSWHSMNSICTWHKCVMGKQKDVPLEVRISECKRRLAQGTLPADVRRTQERILQSLTREQQQREKEKRVQKWAGKYKAVRFFEKRKVTRKLKGAIKRALSTTDEVSSEELQKEVTDVRKKLNYIVHFPLDQKYVSLFASSETADEKGAKKRGDMIASIWRRVTSGELTDASSAVELGASHVHHTKRGTSKAGQKADGHKRHTVDGSGHAGASRMPKTKPSDFFLLDSGLET